MFEYEDSYHFLRTKSSFKETFEKLVENVGSQVVELFSNELEDLKLGLIKVDNFFNDMCEEVNELFTLWIKKVVCYAVLVKGGIAEKIIRMKWLNHRLSAVLIQVEDLLLKMGEFLRQVAMFDIMGKENEVYVDAADDFQDLLIELRVFREKVADWADRGRFSCFFSAVLR